MISDCQLPIADLKTSPALIASPRAQSAIGNRKSAISRTLLHSSILFLLSSILVFLPFSGCIGNPQNPAATQPATEIDLATTQPSYWLSQPPAAQVQAKDFDRLWDSCKTVARSYLFALDREDFRAGLITTEPLISKQLWEFWRPDTGAASDVLANSTATHRRTLRFEIERDEQSGAYTITPKVLVEQQTVLERRITSATQYRTAFAGPSAPSRFSVAHDEDASLDLPPKYWYPIGRDTAMERQVAARLREQLEHAPTPAASYAHGAAEGALRTLSFDGDIIAPGPNDLVYIDLGSQHGVVPGMTFEVYDTRASLPPLEHFGLDNPGSKGWILVQRADQTSSACRVLHNGAPAGPAAIPNKPAPGDHVFNFIFERDRERQNHFVLAGDFTAGRDTLAALIRKWGGAVDDRPNDRTNYVVLGQAPADPTARESYKDAKSTADNLNIPVIDEQRFNLLVRQFESK
jgi:hypothetical protein